MSVRIVDVREITKPISSPIRNAYIDFTKMTTSLVAVVTDVVRDGKRVVGYGFNSNGRYGQGGLIRERFAPRHEGSRPKIAARCKPADNLDPDQGVGRRLMSNEKPGGHGERSVAVGTIDMAVWDAVAKIAGKPLFQLCSPNAMARKADPRVFVYAAGGYYYPGKDLSALRGRDARLSRSRLQRRQDEDRRCADRGGSASAPRPCLRRSDQQCAARRRCQWPLRSGDRESLTPRCCGNIRCSGTRRPAIRSTYALQAAHWPNSTPAPMATGENLFSHQDAQQFDPLWRHAPRSRLVAIRLRAVLRPLRIPAHARRIEDPWLVGQSRCIPHGGHQMSLNIAAGLGLGGNESYPDLFQPYGGFPDGVRVENGHITMPDLPGIGFEGKSDLYKEMRALAE